MYWSRTSNPIDVLAWILLAAMWWTGGWLLTTHTFRLHSRERLITGMATGLLLFITLSNLLSHSLPVPYPFWGASTLILAMGLLAAWKSARRPWLYLDDLRFWPQVLALAGLTLLFAMINRGLAIFDDYYNLPIISMIAAGDLPPHFHLNPTQPLAFHYGLHLIAASMVRIGGAFPWSAFDLSKALSLALTLCLAWLWFRRLIRTESAALYGGLITLFGAGTAWLVLFLPNFLLQDLSNKIGLIGSAAATGPDLYTAIVAPFRIEGGGPLPFPFAFVNGIFSPLNTAMAGSGAIPQLTLFTLFIMEKRRWSIFSGLIACLVFASLALTGEHLFAMMWLGFMVASIYSWMRTRSLTSFLHKAWILFLSAGLSLISGGAITEIIRRWWLNLSQSELVTGYGLPGFRLRWPPVLFSTHYGPLSLTDPLQVLLGLFELGPVLLLAPWVTRFCLKRLTKGKWITAGAGIGALISFLAALFLGLQERERDITRLTNSAMFIWMVFGFVILWYSLPKLKKSLQYLILIFFCITILSGIASFSVELVAVARPQFSYFVDAPDALLSRAYWNRLPKEAYILDRPPFRAITLFGRWGGQASLDNYTPTIEWEALISDPNPTAIAQSGYSFIYIDSKYWERLTSDQKHRFEISCVRLFAEETTDDKDFRRLLDVRQCASPGS